MEFFEAGHFVAGFSDVAAVALEHEALASDFNGADVALGGEEFDFGYLEKIENF